MEKGAANIEITVTATGEHPGRDPIYYNPGSGNPYHCQASDRLRVAESSDRFRRDRSDANQKKDGIEKSGKNGCPAQTVSETLSRTAPPQAGRRPRHQQTHHIGEIMSGIGKESERVAQQPENDFGDDEASIEEHADRESAPEIGLMVVRMTHRTTAR